MSVISRMRGLRREDIRAARDVLLEDVVLDRAASLSASTPWLFATAMYIASSTAAGALMVMLSADLVQRDAVEASVSMSCQADDGDADLAHFAVRHGVVGVVADLRRQVEGDRQTGLPLARAGSGSARWIPRRVAKPAYWRMVQKRPRYMVGCTPRV